MKLPLSWLKDYVEWNVTPEEFVERMMWRGFEVADILDEMPGVSGVVVGRITALEKHPNADKLQICTIDVGAAEPLTIVTGATNVFEGALVPVALDGAKLVGGIEIKPTKMRGVDSFGMLCSGKELGLTEADYPGAEVYGIMILNGDLTLGESIEKAIGMDDIIFDIELTPNRADCQSIIGICREAAAALGQKFVEPVIRQVAGEGSSADYASVTVENTELCPRYSARVVTDLVIEPSPKWMQRRLKAVGMRPINNIVDITNYVLVEYGHPMHAFDLACVKDGHIVVRNAHEGEVVTTLDSKERPVTPDMLLIADPEKGVGIAGVMGGENSEITENTKATLFEAAAFKGSNIRATTRKLRHVTDAAARFIKGVEPVNAFLALERAIELVDELKAGRIIGEPIDVCAADISPRVIDVDYAHVNKILNTAIDPEDMVKMLGTINIEAEVAGDQLRVNVPHFRTDIESGIEADWDIAEEVGRIYGYDNIPPTLMNGQTFRGRVGDDLRDEDAIKDLLVNEGCCEMYNYNFTGPAALDALRIPEGDEKRLAVKLLNPFGEDQSLMRTTLLAGVLDSVARNYGRKTGQTRFFEVGNVHFDNNDDLPEERKLIGIAYAGEEEDFFTLKGSIEALLESFNMLEGYSIEAGGGEYFQPGQKALILADGEVIGECGTIHPKVQKTWGIPQKVYYAEISVEKLRAHKGGKRTYQALPRFPKVTLDIAVVVEERVTAAEMKAAIASAPVEVSIGDVELFDVYRGVGIPEGKKSMAYSFALSAADHTLNGDEIQQAMKCVIDTLGEKLGAQLRA
ncbi:MAG: phenylalanine--tRNA ligase subunit beta [Clostridiales bacterium]|nr:phenylalanine--tRNA ligase subunit beta [Clostridiales bacterium]